MYRSIFIFLFLALTGAAVSSLRAQSGMSSSVLGSGATEASGGGVKLRGTFGQPLIGLVTGSSASVGEGFWYTLPAPKPSAVPGEAFAASSVSSLSILPNPASGRVQVQIPSEMTGERTCILYDALGRAVLSTTESDPASHIDLSLGDLPTGRYTAVLQVGQHRLAAPLLILH